MKISFRVCGKPPKKSSKGSIWTYADRPEQVIALRKSAEEAKRKTSTDNLLCGPLKVKLTIYSPQFITKREDTHNYIGDLDSFVAGVCDSLMQANENVTPHKIFKEHKIDPKKPLIIEDDSNITAIEASKIQDDEEYYTVMVEEIRGSGACGFLKRLRG